MTHIPTDIDLDAIRTLVAAIEENPTLARNVFRAEVTWKGGLRSEATVRGHGPLPSDEPKSLGGADTAPNPVEQVLAAFGHCLAVGYAANAAAAGIELRDLRLELEGDLDVRTFLGLGDGNAGYEAIRVRVHLDAEATPEEVARLHDRVTATSPVGHTLARPVTVDVRLAEDV